MRIPGLLLLLIAACVALGGAPVLCAQDPAPETAWQKFASKPEALAANPPYATPGAFLNLSDRVVAFPAGGLAVDLPFDATFPDGRPVKAALLANHALWIDLDGDGKLSTPERFNPTPVGFGPITVPLKYKDDTQAPYTFHLVATATPGSYRLVTGQIMRFTVPWHHHLSTVLLLDQNNDGRYDEAGQDVVLIDGRPGSFLAKTITLGADADSVAEVVVYPGGTRLELREFAGPTGVLDLVSGYKSPQPAVTICHVAVESELARPGFSLACPHVRVPVGSYQFQSATLRHETEQVRVDRGNIAAIDVVKDKTAVLAWGGAVELQYGFRRAGDNLVFDGLKFVGKDFHERYLPQPGGNIQFLYRADEIIPMNGWPASNTIPLASGVEELEANSDPREAHYKPIEVKHHGHHMFLSLMLTYSSGVMGIVEVHDRLEFTPPPPDDKK